MSTKAYGKTSHSEEYRVVTFDEYPRTIMSARNARYYNSKDKALAAFQISLMNIYASNSKTVRVTLEHYSKSLKVYKVIYVFYDIKKGHISSDVKIL